MGQLVSDRREHEPQRAEESDRPARGRIDVGLEGDEPVGDGDRDDRDDEQPRDVQPDLEAEDPRDRHAVHRRASAVEGPAEAPVATAAGAGDGAFRPASRRMTNQTTAAKPRITTPSTIVVSDQKSNGKSWTRRSVRGSKSYDPAGKKSRWKTSNAASKKNVAMIPPITIPTVSHCMPAP